MKTLEEILAGTDISTIISDLKKRPLSVPDWNDLVKDYEPSLHKIVNDKQGRVDKVHSNGSVDKAARLTVALEKLHVKRITEFTFSIPVKRIYSTPENDTQKRIIDAIELIYKHAHINNENIKRGIAYYASCEIFTMWYVADTPNTLYGFESRWKLKCKTFSPKDKCKLYPIFDEMGDMKAMSFEYEKKTIDDDTVTYFETFTKDRHYKWERDGDNGTWKQVEAPAPISLMKIPGAYLMRSAPIFDGLQPLREDLEYTISRDSDVVAYNCAPILKVTGTLVGDEHKGDSRRVYRLAEGGDVSYVSWSQSDTALAHHIDNILKFYWLQAQMPDISFENMKSLGNIGYDSRRTLLTDAHLKIGEESGLWIEFLEREFNVIKAFLKEMNKSWDKEIDKVFAEHIITPFIIEDEQAQIDMHMKANGGKPVESQRESIMRIGKSKNVEDTINQINEEAKKEAAINIERTMSIFSGE